MRISPAFSARFAPSRPAMPPAEKSSMRIGKNSMVSPRAIIEQPENVVIGDNVRIKEGVVLRPETGIIYIGNNVVIDHYSVIHAKGDVEIGDWTIIAPHCGIFAQNYEYDSFDMPITKQPNTGKGITLMGDNWLGAGCMILDGVTLGKGTIVGAGAIVSQSFPMAQIIVGNPARVIKERHPKGAWEFQKVERCSHDLTPQQYWPYINRRTQFVARLLAPADTVLEVGCGEGYVIGTLSTQYSKGTGIDYSAEAIALARARYPGIDWRVMSATNLDFPDATFDKVICVELVEHLTRLQAQQALREMYRVLKPGGLVIGSTPLRTTPESSPATYSHIHEYSEPELNGLLASFQEVSIAENNYFYGIKPLRPART